MKAITIHQPWAWAIVSGHKRVENRTWPTNYRGPLAIHVSKSLKTYREELRGYAEQWRPGGEFGVQLPPKTDLHLGHLIGLVDLIDCVPFDASDSRLAGPWGGGPWCFVLANPRLLPCPIPMTGRLGIFPMPDGIVARSA